MEDDDEFGDLYTDVLRPSSSASTAPNPLLFPSSAKSNPNCIDSDDEEILYGGPQSNPSFPSQNSNIQKTLSLNPAAKIDDAEERARENDDDGVSQNETNWNEENKEDEEELQEARVLVEPGLDEPREEKTEVQEAGIADSHVEEARVLKDQNGKDEGVGIDEVSVLNEKKAFFTEQDAEEKLEIDVGMGVLDSEPIIPGLSGGAFVPEAFRGAQNGGDAKTGGEDDDWDSDSEDDLQIVLNDNCVPIGMERNEGMGSDEDDEDGEDLVIVADVDQHQPPIEEQDWGEESVQPALDGERKEMPEGGKGNGAMANVVTARIGYSNHGYHSHHSQFKYIRPGATVPPGGIAASAGAPGQVRPPITMGPVAGRGRGDWRPIGIKNIPSMQKGFHSGFGLPAWANNSAGRGFGSGMEFTLPSHKTVFDIDIDTFEEKPWRHPGVDMSDFFNFGLDEDNWKDYCKQLDQLRLEATMQSKIRVYESGRSEQDYDPDLPPELAAAAGLQDVSIENSHLGKTDGRQTDLMGQGRGATRIRPQLPTGRAIQVEGGYGERLPSIDTRPPRTRDSDAIIEIVLKDSLDDSITSNEALEHPEHESQAEDHKGGDEIDVDDRDADTEYFDRFPPTYNGRKREMAARARRYPFVAPNHDNIHEGDGILPFPPEASLQYHSNSKARNPIYSGGPFGAPPGERWPQGTAHERYPHMGADNGDDVIPSQSAQVNKSDGHQRAKSGDSIEVKKTSEIPSPVGVEDAKEPSMEQKDDLHNDAALIDSTEVEGKEIASDLRMSCENLVDSSPIHSLKRQKLSSRVKQPGQDVGSGDDLRITHSDSSKAKSGSSRDFQRRREGGEEEVMQDGRSRHMGDAKRHHDEDEHSYRRRDVRQEIDRNCVVPKGRDDLYHPYPHRDWDSNSTHYASVKADGFERPKERDRRDISVEVWQRGDEDTHIRRVKDEDTRRREHAEESRRRSKVREIDRKDKDEYPQSRKRMDDVDRRACYDKDGITRPRERGDILMGRHESLDDLHSRRGRDEEPLKREHADKEEVLHGYRAREDTTRRKRERVDILDQRRADQGRIRDKLEDHHSVRHRDESWRQKECEDRQRLKQSHEDTQAIQEREEGHAVIRGGRVIDDKQWVGNLRARDDSKGQALEKDYQLKDKRRHSQHPKRRDHRTEEVTSSQHRGREDAYIRENQLNEEDRNSRHEKSSTQTDQAVRSSEAQRMYKEKHRENAKKSKESEGADLGSGKRKQDDYGAHHNEKVSMKVTGEQETGSALITGQSDTRDHGQLRSSSAALSRKSHHHHQEQNEVPECHLSRKHGGDALFDDEQHQSSRRGHSKLECWASHRERDNIQKSQSPSSVKPKETEGDTCSRSLNNGGPDELEKTGGAAENQHPLGEDQNAALESKDTDMALILENQHVDSERVGDDRHLDTVAKLKKRSERFKLPMPSEKGTQTNRKVESEILVAQNEAAGGAIKQERPARKRRWVSS